VAALAGFAVGVAEEAAAAMQTSTGEPDAVRWLDAEDATMRQVLAWATVHDSAMALRLAVALAPWWMLRGRLASQCPLLREAAGHAAPGSDGWCAAQYWLGLASVFTADMAGALSCFTGMRDAIEDRPPSRALADCLRCRSTALANLGRVGEAADDARRSLALAQELGYPAGEALALAHLAGAVLRAGDPDSAVQLARQAEQIPADIYGWQARWRSNFLNRADRGRRAGRRRPRLRGGAGAVPCSGRSVEPGATTGSDGDAGPAGGPRPGRRGAPARVTPDRGADRRRV